MTDYVTLLNEHRDELQARITELENALRETVDELEIFYKAQSSRLCTEELPEVYKQRWLPHVRMADRLVEEARKVLRREGK